MEVLKNHAEWLMDPPCGDVQKAIAEAIWTAVDELKSQEKYRWHDLRKNPEDLPEDGMNIIVWNDSEAGKFYISASPYWVRKCAKHSGYNIVAWKLIEPFEEVERCQYLMQEQS